MNMQQSVDLKEANELLEKSILYYRGQPIGTIAAQDPTVEALNYDQCFIRDFVPSALVFLMQGRTDIVRNFLVETLHLQSQIKSMDCFEVEAGLMPASFKVVHENGDERLEADFGEEAIARVPPVDSCLWWLILLRAYIQATGDIELAYQSDFQTGIKLILDVCLAHRFSLYPTLLVPDGAFMIDRRMGVYGHPLEIQVLFYGALRVAQAFLLPEEERYQQAVEHRLRTLHYHVWEYYWIDLARLNQIYRFEVDEYGENIANKFNIYPESIPAWLTDWLPQSGGYLAGNLGPGRIDFRFFALGNLLAIAFSLASEPEAQSIMDLFEHRWDDLIGFMPVKICYPAIVGEEWRILTGCDPKNAPWSYHNGGNWAVLLWVFAVAAQKTGRVEMAKRAINIAEQRLLQDHYPEYYDGRLGRLIGKEARLYQTWSIAGLVAAKDFLTNATHLKLISFEKNSNTMH